MSDVEGYVGLFFTDGDILDKETVEQNIEWGLGDCEEFMLDFYQVNYEGKNEKGKDEEFTGTLRDCLRKFNMASFKKQWKLEDLNENWKGYEEYIFNDTESEESYEDIFDKY